MIYLFLGQDSLSKDEQLKQIKQEFLAPDLRPFNMDTLYGREADRMTLQEAFLRLPACPVGREAAGTAACRMIVIKDAQELDDASRDFILDYAAKPSPQIVLVLDISRSDKKDEFVNRLCRLSKVIRFKEAEVPDTFALCRLINSRRTDRALTVLSQLLKNGERPERILGGLRYAWEKDVLPAAVTRNRLKLLMKCDLEIKTGRLKPVFALEKLVISLSAAAKPFG